MTEATARRTPGAGDELRRAELAHWRGAIAALADLDTVAAPAAWAMLEAYLRLRVRERLEPSVAELAARGPGDRGVRSRRASPSTGSGSGCSACGGATSRSRPSSTSTATPSTPARTPRSAPCSAASTRSRCDSMEVVLRPLGIAVPPALVYVDKGMGAAILRAGVRLWGPGGPSPVAAIKLTRHNLGHPTRCCHETGHQVAAQTGWVPAAGRRDPRRGRAPVRRPRGPLAGLGERDRRRRARLRARRLGAGPGARQRRRRADLRRPPGPARRPAPTGLAAGDVQRRDCAGSGTAPGPGTPSPHLDRAARPAATAERPARGWPRASLPLLPRVAATCLDAPLPGLRRPTDHRARGPRLVSPAALDALAARGRADAADLGVPRPPAAAADPRPPDPRPAARTPPRPTAAHPTPARLAGHAGPAPAAHAQPDRPAKGPTPWPPRTHQPEPDRPDASADPGRAAVDRRRGQPRDRRPRRPGRRARRPARSSRRRSSTTWCCASWWGGSSTGCGGRSPPPGSPAGWSSSTAPSRRRPPRSPCSPAAASPQTRSPTSSTTPWSPSCEEAARHAARQQRRQLRSSGSSSTIVTDDQPIVRLELRRADDLAVALGPRLAPVA